MLRTLLDLRAVRCSGFAALAKHRNILVCCYSGKQGDGPGEAEAHASSTKKKSKIREYIKKNKMAQIKELRELREQLVKERKYLKRRLKAAKKAQNDLQTKRTFAMCVTKPLHTFRSDVANDDVNHSDSVKTNVEGVQNNEPAATKTTTEDVNEKGTVGFAQHPPINNEEQSQSTDLIADEVVDESRQSTMPRKKESVGFSQFFGLEPHSMCVPLTFKVKTKKTGSAHSNKRHLSGSSDDDHFTGRQSGDQFPQLVVPDASKAIGLKRTNLNYIMKQSRSISVHTPEAAKRSRNTPWDNPDSSSRSGKYDRVDNNNKEAEQPKRSNKARKAKSNENTQRISYENFILPTKRKSRFNDKEQPTRSDSPSQDNSKDQSSRNQAQPNEEIDRNQSSETQPEGQREDLRQAPRDEKQPPSSSDPNDHVREPRERNKGLSDSGSNSNRSRGGDVRHLNSPNVQSIDKKQIRRYEADPPSNRGDDKNRTDTTEERSRDEVPSQPPSEPSRREPDVHEKIQKNEEQPTEDLKSKQSKQSNEFKQDWNDRGRSSLFDQRYHDEMQSPYEDFDRSSFKVRKLTKKSDELTRPPKAESQSSDSLNFSQNIPTDFVEQNQSDIQSQKFPDYRITDELKTVNPPTSKRYRDLGSVGSFLEKLERDRQAPFADYRRRSDDDRLPFTPQKNNTIARDEYRQSPVDNPSDYHQRREGHRDELQPPKTNKRRDDDRLPNPPQQRDTIRREEYRPNPVDNPSDYPERRAGHRDDLQPPKSALRGDDDRLPQAPQQKNTIRREQYRPNPVDNPNDYPERREGHRDDLQPPKSANRRDDDRLPQAPQQKKTIRREQYRQSPVDNPSERSSPREYREYEEQLPNRRNRDDGIQQYSRDDQNRDNRVRYPSEDRKDEVQTQSMPKRVQNPRRDDDKHNPRDEVQRRKEQSENYSDEVRPPSHDRKVQQTPKDEILTPKTLTPSRRDQSEPSRDHRPPNTADQNRDNRVSNPSENRRDEVETQSMPRPEQSPRREDEKRTPNVKIMPLRPINRNAGAPKDHTGQGPRDQAQPQKAPSQGDNNRRDDGQHSARDEVPPSNTPIEKQSNRGDDTLKRVQNPPTHSIKLKPRDEGQPPKIVNPRLSHQSDDTKQTPRAEGQTQQRSQTDETRKVPSVDKSPSDTNDFQAKKQVPPKNINLSQDKKPSPNPKQDTKPSASNKSVPPITLSPKPETKSSLNDKSVPPITLSPKQDTKPSSQDKSVKPIKLNPVQSQTDKSVHAIAPNPPQSTKPSLGYKSVPPTNANTTQAPKPSLSDKSATPTPSTQKQAKNSQLKKPIGRKFAGDDELSNPNDIISEIFPNPHNEAVRDSFSADKWKHHREEIVKKWSKNKTKGGQRAPTNFRQEPNRDDHSFPSTSKHVIKRDKPVDDTVMTSKDIASDLERRQSADDSDSYWTRQGVPLLPVEKKTPEHVEPEIMPDPYTISDEPLDDSTNKTAKGKIQPTFDETRQALGELFKKLAAHRSHSQKSEQLSQSAKKTPTQVQPPKTTRDARDEPWKPKPLGFKPKERHFRIERRLDNKAMEKPEPLSVQERLKEIRFEWLPQKDIQHAIQEQLLKKMLLQRTQQNLKLQQELGQRKAQPEPMSSEPLSREQCIGEMENSAKRFLMSVERFMKSITEIHKP